MAAKKPPKRAKLVTLTPSHIETISEAFDYLLDELTLESASRSPTGFAKRLAMKKLRSVLKHIGA